jgi:hypothetical protein
MLRWLNSGSRNSPVIVYTELLTLPLWNQHLLKLRSHQTPRLLQLTHFERNPCDSLATVIFHRRAEASLYGGQLRHEPPPANLSEASVVITRASDVLAINVALLPRECCNPEPSRSISPGTHRLRVSWVNSHYIVG